MLNPYIFAYLAFAFDGLSIRILRHSNLTLFGTPLQGCLFLKAFYSLRIWMKFFCNPTFDCRDIVQCRCLVLFFLHITWSGLKKKTISHCLQYISISESTNRYDNTKQSICAIALTSLSLSHTHFTIALDQQSTRKSRTQYIHLEINFILHQGTLYVDTTLIVSMGIGV